MKLTKKCLLCGKTITKLQNESLKCWNNRHKYCSRKCADKARIGNVPWNKNKKMSKEFCEKNRKSHLGQMPWNKNLKGVQTAWNKDKSYLKIRDDKHWKWKGDNVGYHALHSWITRKKGKPKVCIDCGATAQERKLQWSNIDHKYRRNIDDYVARCSSCHKKYDIRMNYEKILVSKQKKWDKNAVRRKNRQS